MRRVPVRDKSASAANLPLKKNKKNTEDARRSSRYAAELEIETCEYQDVFNLNSVSQPVKIPLSLQTDPAAATAAA